MKHIFNSLGSNYTLPFSLQALMYLIQLPPRQKIVAKLESACKKLFPAFENGPYFFYKGRDAIEFVLKSHSIGDGDLVLTQAFTCHAIEAAIRRTGAQPVFVDLEENSLHPSVKTISAVYKQHPQVKALIIQHTLGFAAPITKIRKWCTENNILLIEDLAQAFGGVDESGALLGSTADAIILSFGRDKIIDAVSGGVCFIRKYSAHTHTENFRSLTYKVFCTDLWYPFLTYCIRKTYPIYLGKIILFVAKTMGLIVSPVKARFEFSTALPASVAALSLTYFETLPEQLAHRRKIAEIYQAALAELSLVKSAEIAQASCLRFPIAVADPTALTQYLDRCGIHIGDRWYRSAVDSGKLAYASKYKTGSCPNAEHLSARCVNLPTHQFITEADAEYIAECIKKHLK